MPVERRCQPRTPRHIARYMANALAAHGLIDPGARIAAPCWRPDPDHDVMLVAPGVVWLASRGGSYIISATDWSTWGREWTGCARDYGASRLAEVRKKMHGDQR